ncbi:sigma-54-dependent Fis family transcriptional regulator [Aggregicoccus sp. 17bor-14]|uniref:sigma 54-interacting transcriptional regulator n=1 Tax=Myxococcaceae TaxID=31 RepID=UPI00129D03C2|nr:MULTISPECIES: sigma 54-interacting transcriptional regulator [Myxococcaceae]MBF5041655.1 sigma-54-dependent Fis family transcriptional regulator [Simulacricoccus sp. 17bor-14]MRI87439.1 sigma-54-dependent Fis family transcriptional regulator [Aggregicoccus sp. 17bor-14]
MSECWVQTLDEASRGHGVHLAAALQRAGLPAAPLAEAAAQGPGVLLAPDAGPATLQALRELRQRPGARVLVVLLPGQAPGCEAYWLLLRGGASDVLAWEQLEHPVEEIAVRLERWRAVGALLDSACVREHLVGTSPAWLPVLQQVVEVAAFTDASVLLLGESGTGKEEVARLIHALDARPDKRELVTLDCGTVMPELSGSEFFGHERGAFTGAVTARDGAFALADGGTLFLDEVGELPAPLQAQLLRAVQEHTFKRVGSNVWQHADFRLVCATNRDLEGEVARGAFRRDLYHRLAAWVCRLPPLRERPEDILPLARHFIGAARPGRPPLQLGAPVREYLLRRSYPGNVRELRQLVLRLCKRHVGEGPLSVGDMPPEELPAAQRITVDAVVSPGGVAGEPWQEAFRASIRRALGLGVGLKEIGRIAADTAIQLALGEEEGNLQRAARRLGVTDRALQLRRAQHGN